jgi:hypothetical protein
MTGILLLHPITAFRGVFLANYISSSAFCLNALASSIVNGVSCFLFFTSPISA